ncbi:hypothetical protein [Flammeovirga kamogawensis]|nr:hypothetical protein [Flammeovirga kamogawensis]MBB6463593.1 hypothetical protein [Flammeovirga kamogawensis]
MKLNKSGYNSYLFPKVEFDKKEVIKAKYLGQQGKVINNIKLNE